MSGPEKKDPAPQTSEAVDSAKTKAVKDKPLWDRITDTILQTEATEKRREEMKKLLDKQRVELDGVVDAYKENRSTIVGKSNQDKLTLLSEVRAVMQQLDMQQIPGVSDSSQMGVVEDAYERLEAKITGTKEAVDFKDPEFIKGAYENLKKFEEKLRNLPTNNTAEQQMLNQVDAAREAKEKNLRSGLALLSETTWASIENTVGQKDWTIKPSADHMMFFVTGNGDLEKRADISEFRVNSDIFVNAKKFDGEKIGTGVAIKIKHPDGKEGVLVVQKKPSTTEAAAPWNSQGSEKAKDAAPEKKTHTVSKGETLSGIAKAVSKESGKTVTYQELAKLNNIKAPYTIRVGQELKLPESKAPVAAEADAAKKAADAKGDKVPEGGVSPDKVKGAESEKKALKLKGGVELRDATEDKKDSRGNMIYKVSAAEWNRFVKEEIPKMDKTVADTIGRSADTKKGEYRVSLPSGVLDTGK